MIRLTYWGIDSMNRPIFKRIGSKAMYGCTDTPFPRDATEAEVLEKISIEDIVWFGWRPDCEPEGTLPHEPIEIVLNESL